MPSVSKKQHNLMAMVAHDPKAAKRLDISQSVGQEFMKADKGKKFGSGGQARADIQSINKAKTHHGKLAFFARGGDVKEESKAMMKREVAFMKKKSAPKSMIKHEEAEMKSMKMGGFAKTSGSKVVAGGKRPHGEHTVQQKGHTRAMMPKMAGSTTGMKRGGKAMMKRGGKC